MEAPVYYIIASCYSEAELVASRVGLMSYKHWVYVDAPHRLLGAPPNPTAILSPNHKEHEFWPALMVYLDSRKWWVVEYE